jgi:hypothetical protein
MKRSIIYLHVALLLRMMCPSLSNVINIRTVVVCLEFICDSWFSNFVPRNHLIYMIIIN